ncbi:phage tail protein [Tissierella praeacuta]|uniref:phage tail protein n=1 Tax=Tissierella praeacuta TaxID=43131 RepID=UPI0035169D78
MAEKFYTILTNVGKAKIANAQALGKVVNLSYMAIGDGGGQYYNPADTQTALKNEVWRGPINDKGVDKDNPNWIVLEAVIPSMDGGFMVREVGVFDDVGDMIAIGKYPETYKPVVADGSVKDLYVRMILEVSNAAVVNLKVDPAIVLATKKDVDEINRKTTLNKRELDNFKSDVEVQLAEKATKDGTLQEKLNSEKVNGVSVYVETTEPISAENKDIWFDLTEKVMKIKINEKWEPFGAVYL